MLGGGRGVDRESGEDAGGQLVNGISLHGSGVRID